MKIDLDKIPLKIDDKKIKELYNGDYKKALEDTAKSERNLAIKNSYLETKINKYKEILDKIKEYIKENACYDKDIKQCCRDLLTDECDYILELLEEIE